MRKIKIPRFYIGLLIFVLCVVLLSALGNRILRRVLAAYEAAEPQTAARQLIAALETEGRESLLYRTLCDGLSPYETEKGKTSFADAKLLTVPLSLKSTTSAVTAADVQYTLCRGDEKIAMMRLEKDAEGGDFGFVGYHLQSASFLPSNLYTVSVSVPVGYKLYLGGMPVGEEAALPEQTADASAKFMPDGFSGVVRKTYRADALCDVPSIEVYSDKGVPVEIRPGETDGDYVAALAYDEDLAREYADYAIEATKAYAAYMQNDRGFGAVRPYFDAESALYEQLRTSATMWVIDHNGYSFSDEKASEFISYGEGVFSCRVSLTHTLTYPRLKDYHDYIDMTWYFHLVDGKYLIYNSFNNN